ncbi:MAG TPA: tRNA (adenosine(37)-N6)-threonylcarbamoyltransferase complex dimerization subunit type 1 TsaB, partial [Dehalococcoidia bacterium]|nr:tRNA (adenosine(37)-N6)-threonylcarbamoyltransferase complex dimerization subunit type 1 TsaB [Dehalococcoidia bacterium]
MVTTPSLLLTIDTSTDYAGLALARGEEVVAELLWRTGQGHSVELMPNLLYILGMARVEMRWLGGIVVARGPGSFNGLRAGMSVAKGLALSLGIPLVGVSTLEAEALPFAETGLPICPLHNAGRGEVAAALFQSANGCWSRLREEHITTLEVLCSELKRETLFCGELSPVLIEQIESKMGKGAVVAGAAAR